MEVKDSNSGSYAWKSILKGNDELKKGALLRVGNGNDVLKNGDLLRVGNGSSFKLSDNWLPIPNHFKSLSLGATQFLEFLASCLINQSTNLWNSYLVDSLFPPQEASTIKGIPLVVFPQLIFYTGLMKIMVILLGKSAYWFLSLDVTQLDPPQIISSPPQNVRKKIWGCSVPSKVKNFLWKACKNAIPTKSNLVKRVVITEGICEHCKQSSKTPIHAIWTCPCLVEI